MKRLLIACIFIFSTINFGCRKSCTDSTSSCILNSIEANKNNEHWDIQSVEEYEYQGHLVYIFVQSDIYADQQTTVMKGDCTVLCTLGGIAGNQMCNGDNFYEKASFRKKLWQK